MNKFPEYFNDMREMSVYKSNSMIQKGQTKLSKIEQKIIIYAISKIQPNDNVNQLYTFSLAEFYNLCDIEKRNYNVLKDYLIKLMRKTWIVQLSEDEESIVHWFSTVKMSRKSSTVKVKFHEDIMPFLFELVKRGENFTKYKLAFILKMRSNYGISLYELLKSYEYKNVWDIPLESLKWNLGAENKYSRFVDFERRILIPGIADINEFSDINAEYIVYKTGQQNIIRFTIKSKSKKEIKKLLESSSIEIEDFFDDDEIDDEIPY